MASRATLLYSISLSRGSRNRVSYPHPVHPIPPTLPHTPPHGRPSGLCKPSCPAGPRFACQSITYALHAAEYPLRPCLCPIRFSSPLVQQLRVVAGGSAMASFQLPLNVLFRCRATHTHTHTPPPPSPPFIPPHTIHGHTHHTRRKIPARCGISLKSWVAAQSFKNDPLLLLQHSFFTFTAQPTFVFISSCVCASRILDC